MSGVKPTVIGGGTPRSDPPRALAPTSTSMAIAPVNLPADFPVKLDEKEIALVQQKLSQLSITTIPLLDIATLETDPEKALNRVLDALTARIDKSDNPQIFMLMQNLGTAIDEEKLPDLAQRIIDHKPTLGEKVVTFLQSKKSREQTLQKAWQKTQEAVKGSAARLNTVVHGMETEAVNSTRKLSDELQVIDQMKSSYVSLFRDFAVSVAVLMLFQEKSKAEFAQLESTYDRDDQAKQAELADVNQKVLALENRTLAAQTAMVRLPAGHTLARQLETAIVATIQEIQTTYLSRFASIKETLLTLHSAMVTRNAQKLAQAGKDLDENLLKVRGMVMQDVATTAANAPAENRRAAAEMILKVVEQSKQMVEIAKQGEAKWAASSSETRTMVSDAQKAMLELEQRKASR